MTVPAAVAAMTRNRTEILALLRQAGSFQTAQDVHGALRQRGLSIGLATVYRNLAALAHMGEVDAVVGASGETRYRSCSAEHHHHLVCRGCGRTVEVALDALESWCRTTAAAHGFHDVEHSLEIVGTCADCAARA
jgi:Fur family ferric uptake transcriptional regulator